jgi:hypothetical protein
LPAALREAFAAAVVPFGFELERVVVAARGVLCRLRVAWPRLAAGLRLVPEVVFGAIGE